MTPAAVRAGEGGPQRLVVLLRLPVPAPRGARPSPPSMPSAARWTTWSTRCRPVAWPPPSCNGGAGSGRAFEPAAHASGDAGADAAGAVRHRGRHLLAVIEGCQMDLEQTRFLDFPACSATATWWPASWARWRPHLRPHHRHHGAYAHRLGLAHAADQHHPRRGRRRPPRPHLPADVGTAALRREGPRAAASAKRPGATATASRADAFQAERAHPPTTRPWRCCPRLTAGAEAGADDGQHLPHAAARDRGQGFQVLHQRTSLTPLRKLWIATHPLARPMTRGPPGGRGRRRLGRPGRRGARWCRPATRSRVRDGPSWAAARAAVAPDGLAGQRPAHPHRRLHATLALMRQVGADVDVVLDRRPLELRTPTVAACACRPGPLAGLWTGRAGCPRLDLARPLALLRSRGWAAGGLSLRPRPDGGQLCRTCRAPCASC
jgi:hypothetical protein